jgi:hypothetical protein
MELNMDSRECIGYTGHDGPKGVNGVVMNNLVGEQINSGLETIQNVLEVDAKDFPADPKHIVVRANFGEGIIDIGYIFLATNEQQITKFSGGKITLKQQRMYYIPIEDKILDSDKFDIIKVPSEVSDRCNVRYIKHGFACIEVIRHNSILKNNEVLCTLSKIND